MFSYIFLLHVYFCVTRHVLICPLILLEPVSAFYQNHIKQMSAEELSETL